LNFVSENLLVQVALPVAVSVLTFALYQVVRIGLRLEQSTGSDALWLMSGVNLGGFLATESLRQLVEHAMVKKYLDKVFVVAFILALVLWAATLVWFDRPIHEHIRGGQELGVKWRVLAFVPWIFLVLLIIVDYLPFRFGR